MIKVEVDSAVNLALVNTQHRDALQKASLWLVFHSGNRQLESQLLCFQLLQYNPGALKSTVSFITTTNSIGTRELPCQRVQFFVYSQDRHL